MKHLFVLAIVSLIHISANAQDFNLYVQSQSGETGYELSQLQKITFENGAIVITKKDGTVAQQVKLTDISKMYFSSTPVKIEQIENDDNADDNAENYNLAGQRVDTTYKGIIIRNGKKYLNK